MIAGQLEILLFANISRLSDDMRKAERVVGDSMGKVEKSVASAKQAMQSLGMGLSLGLVANTMRVMVDSYTKLDAQLRLSTKSQQSYNQALADIRRISQVAQADISGTTMLYTRLLNVMEGSGVAQSKLNTVTETITFGLKAYGATAAEAASASLQLSQAMGANRLGGEEFRAVMEAMPNVMKVLATSMGVSIGELRALSIAGKITAAEMVKAWGNPEIAAQFRKYAENAQTITGAMTTVRNELVLLIGEFSKATGFTSSAIWMFNALGTIVKFVADNIGVLVNAFIAYVTVVGVRFVQSVIAARAAQMNLNAAHAEALVTNVAVARTKDALTAANMRTLGSINELAAAEKLQAAGSLSIAGRIGKAVGKAGWIGMALFGVWTVVDFLNGMQSIADGAKKTAADLSGLGIVQLQLLRNAQSLALHSAKTGFYFDKSKQQNDIEEATRLIALYDKQVAALVKVEAAKNAPAGGITFTGDASVVVNQMAALNEQFAKGDMLQSTYIARVRAIYAEAYPGLVTSAKLATAAVKDQNAAHFDYMKTIGDETQALIDKASESERELQQMGLTDAQLSALTQCRYDEQIAIKETEARRLSEVAGRDAEVALIEMQIDALKRLKAAESNKTIERERLARIKREKDANEEMWKTIETTAHDTWNRVWNEGRDAFTNIGKTIKSAIYDLLYQMTLKKWIIGVSATATGGTAMAGGMGGGDGVGGIGSWLQAGSSIYNAISGGFTSLATSISTGIDIVAGAAYDAGLSSMGEVLAQNSQMLGSVASYIGAGMAGIGIGSMIAGNKELGGMSGTTTSAIGTGLGMLIGGPIGGVIGGAIGGLVTSIFGGGPMEYGPSVLKGTFAQDGFAGNIATPWQRSGDSGWIPSKVPAAQQKALDNLTAGTASVFVNLIAASGEAKRSMDAWSFSVFRGVNTEERQKQLVIDLAESMGNYLIPSLAQFKLEGENLADTAVRMRDEFVLTDTVLKLVGGSFGAVGFASMAARDNLVNLMGGISGMSATMQSYYQNFFSDAERHIFDLQALDKQFAALGVSTPATREAYRALIESQDMSTVAGRQMFAALMSLNGAFAAAVPAIAAAVPAIAASMDVLGDATKRLIDRIMGAKNIFATLTDYNRAVGLTGAGVSIPAFASGGDFGGGVRLVGENGPELEFTGPSRIASASQTRGMLSGGDSGAAASETNSLRTEMRAGQSAMVATLNKIQKILDKFDKQGMPAERVI